jgi:hypothetical protein
LVLWNFLHFISILNQHPFYDDYFRFLEDLANIYHPETKPWIKTIQGFSSTVQCCGGEIPFFLLSSTADHWH